MILHLNKDEVVPVARLSLEWRTLLTAAMDARQRAYAPYSGFKVGAAVRTATGQMYSGCNVENASYGLTVCAERVAIWKAVSQGEREIVALAVVSDSGATPCGACRQVMHEFAREMPVLVADTQGNAVLLSIEALLPAPFPTAELLNTSSRRGSCEQRLGRTSEHLSTRSLREED